MTLTTEDIIAPAAVAKIAGRSGGVGPAPTMDAFVALQTGEGDLAMDCYTGRHSTAGTLTVNGQRFRVTVEVER